MSSPDVLVIGAGIFGLSVAWACRRAGLSVRVLDAARPGAGASGGVVGALTPHAPSRWRPMMAFQFRALLALAARIAEIEAATGHAVGYARTGRLSPLATEKARAKAEAEAAAAPATWGEAARFEVLDAVPPEAHGWLAEAAAPRGLIRDTLSARVDPRAYLAALAAGLGDAIRPGVAVHALDATGPGASAAPAALTAGGRETAGTIVLAAGAATWGLAAPLAPALAGGGAVKGQAALLGADAVQAGLPLIWNQGLYVIPHGPGRVAVGSTSEKRFDHPGPDALLERVIAEARAAVPALSTAPTLERWAGLRPKPPGREPVVGPLPGHPRIWIAGGGYKIGFGIAHAIGDAVAAGIAGRPASIALPESFAPGG